MSISEILSTMVVLLPVLLMVYYLFKAYRSFGVSEYEKFQKEVVKCDFCEKTEPIDCENPSILVSEYTSNRYCNTCYMDYILKEIKDYHENWNSDDIMNIILYVEELIELDKIKDELLKDDKID